MSASGQSLEKFDLHAALHSVKKRIVEIFEERADVSLELIESSLRRFAEFCKKLGGSVSLEVSPSEKSASLLITCALPRTTTILLTAQRLGNSMLIRVEHGESEEEGLVASLSFELADISTVSISKPLNNTVKNVTALSSAPLSFEDTGQYRVSRISLELVFTPESTIKVSTVKIKLQP